VPLRSGGMSRVVFLNVDGAQLDDVEAATMTPRGSNHRVLCCFRRGRRPRRSGLTPRTAVAERRSPRSADIGNLVKGVASSYSIATQPFLSLGATSDLVPMQEGLTLRARNGGQDFPMMASFNMDTGLRLNFMRLQILKAMKRNASTGLPCSIVFWVQDLAAMKEEVVGSCGADSGIIIEVIESGPEFDPGPGHSPSATPDMETPALVEYLKAAHVRVSISHINPNAQHPVTFEFALRNLASASQIKFDTKFMTQIFAECPAFESGLEAKREALSDFLDTVWERHPDIEIVVDACVMKEDVANRFPKLSPFNRQRRILVQGAVTDVVL